ncbi:MAG TPA: VOC family protein [Planctomycetota bacterium]|nr:VOC family protein [Planctomycetota bacterium]
MQPKLQRITPFLWFDTQAEEAARFYTQIFERSRIGNITHYDPEVTKISGHPAGAVMTVAFELEGQPFYALNGGPHAKFTQAISFVVNCDTQQEVDRYWQRLSEGGDPQAQMCGWLKDRFGLSWQIVPRQMFEFLHDPDTNRGRRAMLALMQMKKLDLRTLQEAADARG